MEKFNKHFCQHCGHQYKLVGQIMWDEVFVDIEKKEDSYIGLTDDFENSGTVLCANCNKDWTGEPFEIIEEVTTK